MKKKLLIAILAITTAFCCVFGVTACDANESGTTGGNSGNPEQGNVDNSEDENLPEKTSGTSGLEYKLSFDGTSYVASGLGTCTQTQIEIASWYNNLWVTEIDGGAFQNRSSLESVTIPDSITSIGRGAFRDCSSLTSITIPDSVTTIDGGAFDNTAYYNDDANWEDGVLYIGKHLIEAQDTVSDSYTIKQETINIAGGAFEDCSSLTSITIPDSVISIGDEAFDNTAYYNNEDNWEEGVLYIGKHLIEAKDTISGNYTIKQGTIMFADYAFAGCGGLTVITIPDSVTLIGNDAFRDCVSLTSITIPDCVTTIGWRAFTSCYRLTSLNIGKSVTSIGFGAFSNCSSLTGITVADGNTTYHSSGNCLIKTASKTLISGCYGSVIPDDGSVTVIGGLAFIYSSITSITIPDSVTSIGDQAFEGCLALESINVSSGNVKYHSSGNCLIETASKTLILGCKNSVIPDDGSVTAIGFRAFLGSFFTSITIPDSVASIGGGAFSNCSSLKDINFDGTKEQWNAIQKGYFWDEYTGNYTIHCKDGDIEK